MSAVMSDEQVNEVQLAETAGRSSSEISTGGGLGVLSQSTAAAREGADAQRAALERRARTPIVPLAWIRGAMQVDPEEAGERRAGRPKLNASRSGLTVGDLDHSLTYMQRRTREVQKLVKDA